MILRISGIVIVVAAFFLHIFFRNYRGTVIPNPTLLWLLSIILFLAGYALIKRGMKRTNNDELRNNKFAKDLKANYYPVCIDLNNCEVKSNAYTRSVERDSMSSSNALMLAAYHSAYDSPSADVVSESLSVIEFTADINGKPVEMISPVIPMDKATLMFKLMAKGTTTLYVHKTEPDKYHLDLDFLYKE